MKTFLLIALLHGNVYVLDSGLTDEDCMAAIRDGVSRIQISETETVSAKGARLACEAMQKESGQ